MNLKPFLVASCLAAAACGPAPEDTSDSLAETSAEASLGNGSRMHGRHEKKHAHAKPAISGALYGDKKAAKLGVRFISGVQRMINRSAEAYAQVGTSPDLTPASIQQQVFETASRLYTEDAVIFPSLSGGATGPGVLAGLLDYLYQNQLTLQVRDVCDVVGLSHGPDAVSLVFTSIAERGTGGPLLLETERFDLVRTGSREWKLSHHDFHRAEQSGVSGCSDPAVAATLQSVCQEAGFDCP